MRGVLVGTCIWSLAEYSNLCRSKGVQGSHTDFLICAVAMRKKFKIYTVDEDFRHYAKHMPLMLDSMPR
ncbi:MAG: hypothetical protein Q9N68_12845 [Gammaproteobacteria bacterium]|nr:hypothetical protein [Gammaproteobacteria bacterium]